MICVALGHCSIDDCIQACASEECVELRLDLLPSECIDHLPALCSGPAKVVATFRSKKGIPHEFRLEALLAAMRAGAKYVDVECDASDSLIREQVLLSAATLGVAVIVSHHNFQATPDEEEIKRIRDNAYALGADIFKVACAVAHPRDNATLLGLLADQRPQIVVGMGELGRLTRIIGPLLGSVMTYAAPNDAPGTAPGQLTADALRTIRKNFISQLGGSTTHE